MASEHVVIKSVGRVHKLTLKKTEPDSAGKYTVKTRGPSSYASLFIEEIPVEFSKKLENVKVMEGELARFECDTNKADAQVQWFKGAKELRQGDKYKFVGAGTKYALEITDSQLEDQSDYTIVLRGRKCTAHLTVEERAATLLRPLADKTVFEKGEVKLECEFTLTVIKTTGGNVFGGFAKQPLVWEINRGKLSNFFVTDPNSFIFSLVNKEERPLKALCSDDGENALGFYHRWGPTFGSRCGKRLDPTFDFIVKSESNTNMKSFSNFGSQFKHPDYPCGSERARAILAGSHQFQAVEIEVFTKVD